MFQKLTLFLFVLGMLTIAAAKEINLNELARDAGKQNRHLLVWLHKTDCSYCEAMREFTLEEPTIAERIEKDFAVIPINIYDHDKISFKDFIGSGKAFAKMIGYNFYPSSIFLDKNSEIVFAAPGYIEEKDFALMLDFVSRSAYAKLGYNCFRQQTEKQ